MNQADMVTQNRTKKETAMFGYAVMHKGTSIASVYESDEVLEVRKVISGKGLTRGAAKDLAFELHQLSSCLWECSGYLPDLTAMSRLVRHFFHGGVAEGDREVVMQMKERFGVGQKAGQDSPWALESLAWIGASLNAVAAQLENTSKTHRAEVYDAVMQELCLLYRLAGQIELDTWYREVDDTTGSGLITMGQITEYVTRVEQWDPTLIEDLTVSSVVVAAVALFNFVATLDVVSTAASLAVGLEDETEFWEEAEDVLAQVVRSASSSSNGEESFDLQVVGEAALLALKGVDPVSLMRILCHPEGMKLAGERLDLEEYCRFAGQIGEVVMEPMELAASCRKMEDICIGWYREFYGGLAFSPWNLEPEDIGAQARLRLLAITGMESQLVLAPEDGNGEQNVEGG